MTKIRIEPKKTVAYIMLAVNVLAFLYVGYGCAHHDAMHYSFWSIEPSKVGHLTLKEDVILDYQIPVPKGTIVYPDYLNPDRISFYFKASGEYKRKEYEKYHRGDSAAEVQETEEYLLHAKPEQFVEYNELERLYKEAKEQARARRSEVFWNDYVPFIIASIFLFAVLCFFTVILSRKRWYVLLYVLNIFIFFNVFFFLPVLFVYH